MIPKRVIRCKHNQDKIKAFIFFLGNFHFLFIRNEQVGGSNPLPGSTPKSVSPNDQGKRLQITQRQPKATAYEEWA